MSEWFHIHEEDIQIDGESEEVDLYVTDNDQGRVYGILSFDQIKHLYEEITGE